MRGVILQPNYIPWYGYFELINTADVFVFLDDVQYTRRDWRNRNKIRTKESVAWLTVPMVKQNRDSLMIKDALIDNQTDWGLMHYNYLKENYSDTKYWQDYVDLLKSIYFAKWDKISCLDIEFITKISNLLNINTKFIKSSDLNAKGKKEYKLIDICNKVGITTYISGPSGGNYIDSLNFSNAGIKLEYFEYSLSQYPQTHDSFDPYVTVLDLLFNCGPKSYNYIK